MNATAQMAAAQNAQREQIDYTAPAGGLYPLLSEYRDAVLFSEDNLDKLKHLKPVLDDSGSPIMSSGNFAVVFKMQDSDGHYYALKCFLRASESRDYNYRLISNQLNDVASPYFVKIDYYAKELFVDTQNSQENEFPVLLMDWVEGKTLDKYIREQRDSEFLLADLAYKFSVFANWIQEQPFAHGDLKPDNIIVRDDGQIVLVDYDGMFVPGMEGQEAREIGSPDFRHPARTSRDFDKDIDYFSLLSILLSLKIISLEPELLDRYCAQDGLLFSAGDYADPDSCPLLKEQFFYDRECAALLDALMSELNTRDGQFKLGLNARTIKVLQNPIMADCFAKVTNDDLANAYEDSYGAFYVVNNGRLAITDRTIVSFVVPKSVSIIPSSAFSGCKSLESIKIPSSVEAIGEFAFASCASLKTVILSEGVKLIGGSAFSLCTSLESVTIPSSVETIEYSAFEWCSNLKTVVLSEGVRFIGSMAFSDCTSLESITIPSSVETIEYSAFERCSNLKTVVLSEGVRFIDSMAFSDCTTLESITLPSSVETIGKSAFYNCTSLKTVILSESVRLIGEGAFYNCTTLESIMLPSSVEVIGEFAFISCTSLKTVILLEGVRTIGEGAFGNCTTLESITIPSSVKTIDGSAFSKCSNLKTIVLSEGVRTIGEGAFYNCTTLESITIPSSVETIGHGAFEGCTSLESIEIPSSVESIKSRAFWGCTSLRTVILPDKIMSVAFDAFEGCPCNSLSLQQDDNLPF